jgi:2-hydroxychromene-2-carboxylate isomerase
VYLAVKAIFFRGAWDFSRSIGRIKGLLRADFLADAAKLPLCSPTEHHPVKSVWAMRTCCALEHHQAALFRLSLAVCEAYFARGENIDDALNFGNDQIPIVQRALLAS